MVLVTNPRAENPNPITLPLATVIHIPNTRCIRFNMIGEKSESYIKIVDFIHKKKSVTKKEILDFLNWGVRISFNSYRNRLRNEPTIRFTKNRYEVI